MVIKRRAIGAGEKVESVAGRATAEGLSRLAEWKVAEPGQNRPPLSPGGSAPKGLAAGPGAILAPHTENINPCPPRVCSPYSESSSTIVRNTYPTGGQTTPAGRREQTLDPVAVITAVPNSAIGSHARGGGSGARARECGEARGPCSPALLNDQWPWLWLWPWLWPWPWPWPWLWPWPWPWFRTLCSNQLTHWPWFLNDGDVNELQPPCLHWSFEVGPPVTGTSGWPLKVMLLRSAVPWTSISTSTDEIVPVGTGTWFPPAAIVAAVKV